MNRDFGLSFLAAKGKKETSLVTDFSLFIRERRRNKNTLAEAKVVRLFKRTSLMHVLRLTDAMRLQQCRVPNNSPTAIPKWIPVSWWDYQNFIL